MDLYLSENYRDFIKSKIQEMPKGGHGQNKRLAQAAGVSTAFFSQVLADKRHLSLEQGVLLAGEIGLSESQTSYFLTMIERDRAGNQTLRTHFDRQLEKMKKSAQSIERRFSNKVEVADSSKPLYYSDWSYIAVQQLTAIPGFDSEYKIAERLDLPIKRVRDIVEFLLETGLCIKLNDKLKIGPARIHLSPDSPWIKQHHMNWRTQALRDLDQQPPGHLHYSSPMTLSEDDFTKIKLLLLSCIESVAKIVDPSPSEQLTCLNIDWFKVGR